MATYAGGNVVLKVTPNFTGVHTLVRAQGALWGRSAGEDFARAFNAQLRGLGAGGIGPGAGAGARGGAVSGNAFAGEFDRVVRSRIQAAAASLPKIPITLMSGAADREIAKIRGELELLGTQRIGIDIDDATATAKAEALRARLAALAAAHPNTKIEIDSLAAQAQLAEIEAALAKIRGQKATAKVDVDSAGLDVASGRLVRLIALASSVAPALVPIGGALAGVGAAMATGLTVGVAGIGATYLGLKGVGAAVQALGKAQDDAGANAGKYAAKNAAAAAQITTAQRSVASAEASLANARAQAGDAAAKSARSVTDAQAAVVKAEQDSAQSVVRARRQVADAQSGLDRARDSAAQSAVSAERAVVAAERNLAQAQAASRRAQEDLNAARRQAVLDLQDLASKAANAALSEQQAVLDLARAREENAKTQADPKATYLERAQALLTVREAQQRLSDAQRDNTRTQAENAAAQKAGVDGSAAVVDAQGKVVDANGKVADSQVAVKDAQGAAARAQKTGAEQVAQAQQSVADAQANLVQAQADGAAKVAAAQQGVTDAVASAASQQRQSAYSVSQAQTAVIGAQEQLRAAYAKTGEQGSASMTAVKEAMGNLGPAGQEFALFINGLRGQLAGVRDAAEAGLLPGLTDGIKALLPSLPQITGFVGGLAGAMGDLARQAGQALSGAGMAPFFSYMATTGATTLTVIGQALGDLVRAFGNLLVAFGPLSGEFIAGFARMTESFANWAAGLSNNPAFQDFVAYIQTNTPLVTAFLSSIRDAFVNIVQALAPMGPVILQVITGFLDFIAAIPPPVLLAIAGAVTGIALAIGVATGAVPAIIAAAVLMVGALSVAWQNSETFRDIVKGAFSAVADAATWLWQNVISPAFAGIAAAISWAWTNVIQPTVAALVWYYTNVLAPTITWLWLNVISPAFAGISAAISWAWMNVIQPTVAALVWYWNNVLAPTITWLWHNVVEPAFAGIQLAISVAWTLIQITLGLLKIYFEQVLAPVFTWLWHNVVEPVFNGIAATVSFVWEHLLKPVFDALGGYIERNIAPAFQRGVDAIGRAWDKLQDLAKAPVQFVLETVLQHGLIDNFNKLADAFHVPKNDRPPDVWPAPGFARGGIYPGYTPGRDIGLAAVSGGEAIMRPEWTRAVGPDRVEAMNAAARRGGVAGVQRFLGAFAAGGVVPPASKGIVALGHWLQSIGADVTEHAAFGGVHPVHKGRGHYEGRAIDVNHGAGTSAPEQAFFDKIAKSISDAGYHVLWRVAGHFNHLHAETTGSGNLLSRIGGAIGGAWEAAKRILGDLNPFDYLAGKVKGLIGGAADSPFAKLATSGATTLLERGKDFITGMFAGGSDTEADPRGGGGGGGSFDGPGAVSRWTPQVLQVLSELGQPATLAGAVLRRIKFESGGNPNAINLTDSNARAGHPSEGLMQVIPDTFKAFAGKYLSLGLRNPLANIFAGSNYALHRYHSLAAIDPLVRPKGYDSGGFLPPGVSQVFNGTGKPEPVLTRGDFDLLRKAATARQVPQQRGPMVSVGTIQAVDAAAAARALETRFRDASTLHGIQSIAAGI